MTDDIQGLWRVLPDGLGGFFLHASDTLPADRLNDFADAVVEVLARPTDKGRLKQCHGLVADLAELFLAYDRDGIPRPTRGLLKVHALDGRIIEIFRKHEVGGISYEDEEKPVKPLVAMRWSMVVNRMKRFSLLAKKVQSRRLAKAESAVLRLPPELKDVRRYVSYATVVADRWRELGAG